MREVLESLNDLKIGDILNIITCHHCKKTERFLVNSIDKKKKSLRLQLEKIGYPIIVDKIFYYNGKAIGYCKWEILFISRKGE